MRVAIFARVIKQADISCFETVMASLQEHQLEVTVYAACMEQLQESIPSLGEVDTFSNRQDLVDQDVRYMVTLGGDGTILQAVTFVHNTDIPIAGINLGRLGFLAGIEHSQIKNAIEMLVRGSYYIDKRSLLHVESEGTLFTDAPYALNDVTLHKRDTSSMVTIHAHINGEYLNSYWADGIIIATPTGSTGYSLSCGGPIVFPGSGNFVITPVAPHNLNVRPIVISDSSVISLQIEGRAANYLCTLDSRNQMITAEQRIAIRQADFQVSLIRLQPRTFMSTIRTKLSWGTDSRNS